VKEFFCLDIPPGGREKDNKKTIVNENEKIVETGYDRSGVKTMQKNYFGWFLLDRGQIEGMDIGS
jgi:hypothetical protein